MNLSTIRLIRNTKRFFEDRQNYNKSCSMIALGFNWVRNSSLSPILLCYFYCINAKRSIGDFIPATTKIFYNN